MSKAPDVATLLKYLAKWKVPYVPVRRGESWTTHNREGHGAWGDMHGVLNHHTASKTTVNNDVAALWDGLTTLPGPLCNFGVARDGKVYLIGYGRANHAGKGDRDVYQALLNETAFPKPDLDSVDGNAVLYGIEVMNNGRGEAYTPAQIESLIRINAALCDFHGWSAKSSLHHKEWTKRKIDMSWNGDLRAEVARALKEGPEQYAYPKKISEVKYNVVVFALDRDVAAASGVILTTVYPAVVTSNITEVKNAIARKEKVWVVGGPAVKALGLAWSIEGQAVTNGNVTAFNGKSGLDTVRLFVNKL